MKRILTIIVAMAAFLAAENTADAQFLKNLLNKFKGTTTTTTTAPAETATAQAVSAAATTGQTAGTALKALYSQYKADGKKLDMSNVTNLLNLASLAGAVQELKSSDAAYKKDYAKGLILGSTNLVTDATSSSVVSKLTSFANIDLSSLMNNEELKTAAKSAVEAKATEALSKLASSTAATEAAAKAETAATKASTTIENATQIANSVSTILNLFK